MKFYRFIWHIFLHVLVIMLVFPKFLIRTGYTHRSNLYLQRHSDVIAYFTNLIGQKVRCLTYIQNYHFLISVKVRLL